LTKGDGDVSFEFCVLSFEYLYGQFPGNRRERDGIVSGKTTGMKRHHFREDTGNETTSFQPKAMVAPNKNKKV
jgi:hypothetical protein